MKVSMNGFRRQLTGDAHELRDLVASVVKGDHVDHEDLVYTMNELLCKVNGLNCIYLNDDPDFSDMGDLEVELLEPNGDIAA